MLDSNLIIYSAKNLDCFKVFYDDLNRYNVVSAIDEIIKLEFLRSANSKTSLKKKEDFLNTLLGGKKMESLSVTKETFINARRISNLYHSMKLQKYISITDCLIAAQLKLYEKNLFLATANNKHFPLKLFDRINIYCIELKEEIIPVGIYRFSGDKYNKLVESFSKSKA